MRIEPMFNESAFVAGYLDQSARQALEYLEEGKVELAKQQLVRATTLREQVVDEARKRINREDEYSPKVQDVDEPSIDSIVYVGPGDDHTGGWGTVTMTERRMSGGEPATVFVRLLELPASAFNWSQYYRHRQAELREVYPRRTRED